MPVSCCAVNCTNRYTKVSAVKLSSPLTQTVESVGQWPYLGTNGCFGAMQCTKQLLMENRHFISMKECVLTLMSLNLIYFI